MRLNDLPAELPASSALKEALACRATSVAVITVQDGDDVRAATLGSFIGASILPPLVAFTCGIESRTLALLPRGARAGIALLGEHQQALARACAEPDRGALDARHFERDRCGVPVIAGGAARFSLQIAAHYPAGDHVVVLAVVLEARTSGTPPLVYHHRRYRRLASP